MSIQDTFKSQSTLLRAIPVMTVNDIDRSLTFFSHLGFQVHHLEGGFAIIKRDAIEVHFTHHPEMRPEENNSVCRIAVSNIDALCQEVLAVHTLHPHLFSRMPSLTTQPWGREINIVDPCGILIRFSESAS